MIIVTEEKNGNEISFKEIIQNTDLNTESEISWKIVCHHEKQDVLFLMYDKYMVPSIQAYEYLNVFKSAASFNARSQSSYALKLLFSYQDIIGKSLSVFTTSEVQGLVDFLLGKDISSNYITFRNLTKRKPETVNIYLSVYRDYLSFLGIDSHPLKRHSYLKVRSTGIDTRSGVKYTFNKSTGKNIEVPLYISVDDFIKILHIIRDKYSLREECIVRLMYESGMRIGEVLGLTNEDIRWEKRNGKYTGVVYIRNRTTDNHHSQNAKSVIKVSDVKDYQTEAYTTYNSGYQIVTISKQLYDIIGLYIEREHKAAQMKSKLYKEKTIADSVTDDDINFYVFLNGKGTPLLIESWNKIIKKIFHEANIVIDKKVRKNNLNHRFRHGFAMFQVQYNHMNAIELASLMRHKTIHSVQRYYNPTISDKIALKNKYTQDLYSVIPNLGKNY